MSPEFRPSPINLKIGNNSSYYYCVHDLVPQGGVCIFKSIGTEWNESSLSKLNFSSPIRVLTVQEVEEHINRLAYLKLNTM
jgi:hypothetical protein